MPFSPEPYIRGGSTGLCRYINHVHRCLVMHALMIDCSVAGLSHPKFIALPQDIITNDVGQTFAMLLTWGLYKWFLADSTIGRAFRTVSRLSVVCDVYCGETVRPS